MNIWRLEIIGVDDPGLVCRCLGYFAAIGIIPDATTTQWAREDRIIRMSIVCRGKTIADELALVAAKIATIPSVTGSTVTINDAPIPARTDDMNCLEKRKEA